MKIERINENQIRCTLTRADLIERHLKLSELAYGTDKAKSLLQEMMDQAERECGFEVDNSPLMIEAVPASPDSIVLVITKVVPPSEDLGLPSGAADPYAEGKGPVIMDRLNGADGEIDEKNPIEHTRLYVFTSLDTIIEAARVLERVFVGANSLYKDERHGDYILVLTCDPGGQEAFNRACNMLSEYGMQNMASGVALAYLEEHCKPIVTEDALQTLALL